MRMLFQARSYDIGAAMLAIVAAGWITVSQTCAAKEAEWIWSPAYEKELAPPGVCYFRKTFT